MNQSVHPSQYVIQPPSFPTPVFRVSSIPYAELMEWAKMEYSARLDYCVRRGYWHEHRILTSNYSPVRILSELSGFRRYCSMMTERVWNKFSRPERRFLVDALELRDLLLKSSSGRRFDD